MEHWIPAPPSYRLPRQQRAVEQLIHRLRSAVDQTVQRIGGALADFMRRIEHGASSPPASSGGVYRQKKLPDGEIRRETEVLYQAP